MCWADEIIVVNKSSTDQTEQIARSYDSTIRVLTVPYSSPGQEHADEWFHHASHDWIFIGTCSEVPTRRLISEVRSLFSQGVDSVDLVMVPRRMYSLGIHHPTSPWSISYYPFLFHRQRAIITNVIHEHVKAADPSRVKTIAYSEDCCVYHLTHPSAERFIEAHAEYARIEAEVDRDPEQAILGWFKAIPTALKGIMRTGKDWPAIFAAWSIYNLMNVLLTWEKARGLNVPVFYQHLRLHLLAQEWGIGEKSDGLGRPELADGPWLPKNGNLMTVGPQLKHSLCVVYYVASIYFYFRHPLTTWQCLLTFAARQKARVLKRIRLR